jgi:hypothetical protein
MALLKSAILSVSDQQKLFSDAGYCDVEIFEERARMDLRGGEERGDFLKVKNVGAELHQRPGSGQEGK